MKKTLSRIGTALVAVGFVLVVEDWSTDFGVGMRWSYVMWWMGVGAALLGFALKIPKLSTE
ncbi:MAG: hypothetical protein AAB449_00890 [Patescibacteria group bacterium]